MKIEKGTDVSGIESQLDDIETKIDEIENQGVPNPVFIDVNATGDNDGTSWENAYTSLATATASCSGGENLLIAPGIYDENASATGVTINKSNISLTPVKGFGTVVIGNSHASATSVLYITGSSEKGVSVQDLYIKPINRAGEATQTIFIEDIYGVTLRNIKIIETVTGSAIKFGGRDGPEGCLVDNVQIMVLEAEATSYGINYDAGGGHVGNVFRNIKISGDGAIAGYGTGIRINSGRAIFKDITIHNLGTGFELVGGSDNIVSDLTLDNVETEVDTYNSSICRFVDYKEESLITAGNSVQRDLYDINTRVGTVIASQGVDALGVPWFVDASVVASGDGKTPETAFKTIQEGHTAASSGDSIIIKGGTYDENVNTTGLTITKSNLRFIGAPPFQVIVKNTNVGATHAVYMSSVNNVSINNFIFDGNSKANYGLEINGATSQLNTITSCASTACTVGYRVGGVACFIENCFSLYDDIAIEVLTGSAMNFIEHFLAITLFVGPASRGIIFRTGSTLQVCRDLQMGGFNTGVESEGGTAIIEGLVLAANTTNVTDPGTDLIIAKYDVQSKIATNSSTQDDLKAIYDDTKYLSSTALGTPIASSIGSKVIDISNDTAVLVAGLYLQTGAIWYCDAAMGVSGDGKSPITAFKTIQEGHDAASSGDVIVVASGTYIENANVEGLKVTTNGLRFLGKSPFQVQVLNNNVGKTSTIYINAQYVEFSNFVTGGDILLGGCSRGWMIDSGSTLCQLNNCAAYLHSEASFHLNGAFPTLESCMTVLTGADATTYAYYLAGGSIIMKHCTAAGGELVNATGVYVNGGSYHQVIDCHVNYYGTGFLDAGSRAAYTNCSALNCTTPWNVTGESVMGNCSKVSEISATNVMQDDLSDIYTRIGAPVGADLATDIAGVQTSVDDLGRFGTTQAGTLNDANLNDEITTASSGATAYIGISLENMVNADSFNFYLERWDGSAWRVYTNIQVINTLGVLSFNDGSGAINQNIDEINWEDIFIDSTRKLRIRIVKNSATDRDFPYFYNLEEKP